MRGWDRVFSVAFTAILACGCFGATAQERPQTSACGGETIAQARGARVIDGRTFALDDGREVRLASIEVPPLPLPGETDAAPGGTTARDALAAFITDKAVILKQAEAQTNDRYGRIVAYVFTGAEGGTRFVQADLLAAGMARVAARVGQRTCAAELLSRERTARAGKLGLWASSYYELRDAEKPADLLGDLGHFALVEGRVVSVRESGATIYVNFGRRWTQDFTVTILKRNERNFTAAGLEPGKLAGRRVRVRGWIEERGGPWIEASRPEQIEFVDRE
jgi:endonuclease YncB( thermonuclease family)